MTAHGADAVDLTVVIPAHNAAATLGRQLDALVAQEWSGSWEVVVVDNRSTDATVYCVAEGSGRSLVGSSTLAWETHDVFVVPSWCRVSHEAQGAAVLFSFSDRPVQKALGLWREQAPAL